MMSANLVPPVYTQTGASLVSLVSLLAQHQPHSHDDSDDSDSDELDESPLTSLSSLRVTTTLPFTLPTEPDAAPLANHLPNHHKSDSEETLQGEERYKDSLSSDIHDPLVELVEAALLEASDTADLDDREESQGSDGGEEELSNEQRLALWVEEFGKWRDDETEEFVAQTPGVLYRGVLIKGLLGLTTKRFFILAWIPQVSTSNKVIRAGPVTVHSRGWLKKKRRRCWFELKADSVTSYRSSTKLYKPIHSCRLSQIKDVIPHNPDEPHYLRVIKLDGSIISFKFDTAESAMGWNSDLVASLFTFRSTSEKLRLSLPLSLITKVVSDMTPYLSLPVERFQLHFNAGVCNADGQQSQLQDLLQTVEFAYQKHHHEFGVQLMENIELAKQRPPCSGVKPVLEIETPMSVDEQELRQTLATDRSLASQFCRIFALKDQPSSLYIATNCEVIRTLPAWGSLAISSEYLCFWRKSLVGADIRIRIPLHDIVDVVAAKAFGFRIFGLAVQIRGAADVRFDFLSIQLRNEVLSNIKAATDRVTTLVRVDSSRPIVSSPLSASPANSTSTSLVESPSSSSSHSRSGSRSISEDPLLRSRHTMPDHRTPFQADPIHTKILGVDIVESSPVPIFTTPVRLPVLLGAPTSSNIRMGSKHFVCLTIGSRGDVQPYVALGRELLKDGHRVTIASHPEYREWVESYGMSYKDVGGDPGLLMRLVTEHPIFSPSFFKESLGHFKEWLNTLFSDSWDACQGADVLLESPSAMAGIHIAEALRIPYFRCFTMPWTSTSQYPQAFASGLGEGLGPSNLLSYKIYDTLIWTATAGQVNRWRKNQLGLPPTNLAKLGQDKVPFIYNFSSAVMPKPLDWPDYILVSGYWFLDDDKPWDAPPGLLDFISAARTDGKKLIYIGFGSILVPNAAEVTRAVVTAVLNSDVRCILCKGWSTRGETSPEEVALPPEIFSVPSVAHDRLFPLIDAAVHHGGSGTTAASLRAGLPTLISPFFGDQHLWAQRMKTLGCGVRIESLTAKDLTSAIKQGTTDKVMKDKAEAIGAKIRSENGVRTAINWIREHILLAQERIELQAARARNEKLPPANPNAVATAPNRALSLLRRRPATPTSPPASPGSITPSSSLGFTHPFPTVEASRTSSDLSNASSSTTTSRSSTSATTDESLDAKKVSVPGCIVQTLSKAF